MVYLVNLNSNGCQKVYETHSPLALEYEELRAEVVELNSAVSKAERSANSALSQVTTINALVKNWPEVEPFIPLYALNPEKNTLPAIQTSKLNEIFKLPKAA